MTDADHQGRPFEQENKIARSALRMYFKFIEVVGSKAVKRTERSDNAASSQQV
jgi:hypothetical protein